VYNFYGCITVSWCRRVYIVMSSITAHLCLCDSLHASIRDLVSAISVVCIDGFSVLCLGTKMNWLVFVIKRSKVKISSAGEYVQSSLLSVEFHCGIFVWFTAFVKSLLAASALCKLLIFCDIPVVGLAIVCILLAPLTCFGHAFYNYSFPALAPR